MFRESFDQLRAEHRNVTVDYVLSDPKADDSWNGRMGHIQNRLPDALDSLEGTDFYCCGVPELVVDTEDPLNSEGISEDAIYTEGWDTDATGE